MLISIHYQMQYSFNKHSKNVLLVKKTMIIDNHLINNSFHKNKNEEDQNKTKKKQIILNVKI